MTEKEELDKIKKQIKEEVIPVGEHFKKPVDLIWDGKQFGIKIPKKIAEAIKLKKGDKFIFHLLPKEEGFKLRIELRKNE